MKFLFCLGLTSSYRVPGLRKEQVLPLVQPQYGSRDARQLLKMTSGNFNFVIPPQREKGQLLILSTLSKHGNSFQAAPQTHFSICECYGPAVPLLETLGCFAVLHRPADHRLPTQ